jgi:hypothetical protein
MATIKTSGGKIITKGGKPSCTCCGCNPDVLIVYAQITVFDPEYGEAQFNEELSGGLNAGVFSSDGGLVSLFWDTDRSPKQWVAVVSELDLQALGPVVKRCDPEGLYVADIFTVRISFTPF